MDALASGWFSELNEDMWPGESYSLKYSRILHREMSAYQDIVVFESQNHGNVLVLDGIIQCVERDEFTYQEMIAMLPLCAHAQPISVLIVGGGDGGVAREVVKHPLVQTVVQVEIDERVVAVSKAYLPFMAKGYDHPKVKLCIGDGFEFMQNHEKEFDVIITDSCDPIGPAVALFQEDYFSLLKKALKPGGIICSQSGTIWSNIEKVVETMQNCRKHFCNVKFAVASVPTYPTGQIGFILATMDESLDLTVPKTSAAILDLKYYDDDIHRAAFVLPLFAREKLRDK